MKNIKKLEKNQIDRKDIKSNILNNIVITFHYKGLNNLEKDILKIVDGVKEKFDSYELITLEHTDIDLSELINRNTKLSLKDIGESICYIFRGEDDNESLTISNFFIQYNIKCHKYKKFSYYSNNFNTVIKNLEKVTQFYKPIKLSHRKVNMCIIKDITKLYDYFEKDYYNNPYLNQLINNKCTNKNELLAWDSSSKFLCGSIDFNFINSIGFGYVEEDKNLVTRVVADIQGEIEEDELIKFKNNKEYISVLDEINKGIFNIFSDVITLNMLNMMVNLDWKKEEIEGVCSND